VLELELQLASVGAQQQMQQSTGKGRAVAWCLVAGCGVASLQRCRCLGALTWAAWYTKGAAPARQAPALRGCIAAQLEPPFHTVFRSVLPRGYGVCVFGSLTVEALLSVWHAFRVWSIARGPLLSDSPFCRHL
jgi:hypothetical protein